MNSLFIIINLLSMYKVVWTNTLIEIPLTENTHQYYDLPQASLYKNGVLVSTEEFYYEQGVNRTSLTVINSNHVKEFRVDYRVDFYELGITSEQTITYKIVDITAPVVIKKPSFRFPVNTKIPTDKVLLEDLYYQDNYYDNSDIIVKINNLSNININIVGIYEIEYELMDPSFNTTKVVSTYEVFDNNLPTIKYSDPIIHNYGDVFDHYKHFKYEGNNLIIEVDDSSINFNVLGIYPITIKATNSSDLSHTVTTTIRIVDNIKPVITLKSNITPINVGTIITDKLLLSYIVTVSDNYDALSLSDITIINDIDVDVIGKYVVKYNVIDSSNNEANVSMNIEVKDLIKPEIVLIDELIFNVITDKPYWQNYFIITDNYDDLDNLKVVYGDKNLNLNKLGIYYLEVEVTDSSKNKTVATYEVVVRDLLPPEIEVVNDIYIYDFIKGETDFFKNHFIITDNWSPYNDITIILEDEGVDYTCVSENEINVIFRDESENETKATITIYILDIYPPRIELLNNVFIYFIGSNVPDFYDNILEVSDNLDMIDLNEVTITNNIDFNKVGKYEVIYELTDSSYNKTTLTIDFYVDRYKSVLITGNDLVLKINDSWQELDGISLSEDVISYEVIYTNFETDNPLITTVLYIAYDERGNSYLYEQKIEVNGIVNNSDSLIKQYLNVIILSVIFVVIIIIMFYYDKKYKKINF